jgi:coenzyme F420-reducing hydrogenase alpha subunit
MKDKAVIKVDYLCRVEGEGGFSIKIENDQVKEVKLNIFEPPRLFEAFLRGRQYWEVPDITARICGICPIAYIMSSSTAMEAAFGATVDGPLRALRRLIYCGEWIESHALHVFMLHAPDFLGYQDAIQMAGAYPEIVRQGLELKKMGNEIVILLGGREVHPVNCKVGGFYKLPRRSELLAFKDRLKQARDTACETARWAAGLEFPDFEQDYEFVALSHPDEYAMIDGRLISSSGLDIEISAFEAFFEEEQVPHSTSLHAELKDGGTYLVGPMARFNLNFDRLSSTAQQVARDAGLGSGCRNPFKSIIVRSVEIVHAFDEALQIIDSYRLPEKPAIAVTPKAATGYGCTEAPRGICWHRYRLDGTGLVQDARIVPPTSQNQKVIEEDLRNFAGRNTHLSSDKLAWRCEQAVRNYDPCISCSCHCLDLRSAAPAGKKRSREADDRPRYL